MVALHHWPASLPQLPAGYEEQLPNLRQEFIPDAGRPKIRSRISSAGEIPVTLPFEMTGGQVDAFRTFYMDTTKNGTEYLAFPHPQKNRTSNPGGVGEWTEARIAEARISNIAADLWSVEVEFRLVV